RVVLHDEGPDVLHQVVLEGAEAAVEEKRIRADDAGPALRAAVRDGDDGRCQLAAGHRLVEEWQDELDERLLVLVDAVQPEEQRVALARVEPRRQVDVEVAPLLEGGRPDTVVGAVVVGAVKELRSEEHTSELQSLTNLVCRLLLAK